MPILITRMPDLIAGMAGECDALASRHRLRMVMYHGMWKIDDYGVYGSGMIPDKCAIVIHPATDLDGKTEL